jgi:hypothetical protein
LYGAQHSTAQKQAQTRKIVLLHEALDILAHGGLCVRVLRIEVMLEAHTDAIHTSDVRRAMVAGVRSITCVVHVSHRYVSQSQPRTQRTSSAVFIRGTLDVSFASLSHSANTTHPPSDATLWIDGNSVEMSQTCWGLRAETIVTQ